jgi:hypothetical protein
MRFFAMLCLCAHDYLFSLIVVYALTVHSTPELWCKASYTMINAAATSSRTIYTSRGDYDWQPRVSEATRMLNRSLLCFPFLDTFRARVSKLAELHCAHGGHRRTSKCRDVQVSFSSHLTKNPSASLVFMNLQKSSFTVSLFTSAISSNWPTCKRSHHPA